MKSEKVLILSLLRVGDIFAQNEIIRAIVEKHSKAEIHFLVNSVGLRAQEMFGSKIKWIEFPRHDLQKKLGDADLELFAAHKDLMSWLRQLKSNKFNTLYNLTPNKISGYISEYLDVEKNLGLRIKPNLEVIYSSPWLEYNNNFILDKSGTLFHTNDVIKFAYNLQTKSRVKKVKSTPSKEIVFQVLSSDTRKDWPVSGFKKCLQTFVALNPGYKLSIVCAPGEEKKSKVYIDAMKAVGIHLELQALTFTEVRELIASADLLVSVDTSIKHLGAMTSTPVIELALGSADPRMTGIYGAQHITVQPRTDCYPCRHSELCKKESFECQEQLDFEAMALVIHHRLNGNWLSLKKVAQEYQDRLVISKSQFIGPLWVNLALVDLGSKEFIAKIFEKLSIYFGLEGVKAEQIGFWLEELIKAGEFGTQTNVLKNLYIERQNLENQLDEVSHLQAKIKKYPQIKNKSEEAKIFLAQAKKWVPEIKQNNFVQTLPSAQGLELNFIFLRTLQKRLSEFEQQNFSKLTFIKKIIKLSTEAQHEERR